MLEQSIITAPLPPELLGKQRTDVKLLAIDTNSGKNKSIGFKRILHLVKPGDLILFNNSRLLRASVPAYFPELGIYGNIHVGTSIRNNQRLVEPRTGRASLGLEEGSTIELLGSGETMVLGERHKDFRRFFWAHSAGDSDPIKIAALHGRFIRYGHIPFDLPESYYETEFSRIPGSVEFPSAARPFTADLLKQISDKGVSIAQITLHCNLGSLEPHEFQNKTRLLDEQFHIPPETVELISEVKANGNRVIAVGTSVVRALESSIAGGKVKHGNFMTDLYIRPGFKFKVVDAMVTGMHEEEGSHIGMITAFAGKENLDNAYFEASRLGFHWHEFGDLALIGELR